jgi:hypothetical protein
VRRDLVSRVPGAFPAFLSVTSGQDSRRQPRADQGHSHVIDRLPADLVPPLGFAHAKHDLCVRVLAHQLPIERAAGPIDGRLIAREEGVPIDGLAA